jgi:hypothetical protein
MSFAPERRWPMAETNVTPIRHKATRPPECERALALLKEARGLLVELVESGQVEEGSPPDATLCYLDDAIGMLTPEEDEPSRG